MALDWQHRCSQPSTASPSTLYGNDRIAADPDPRFFSFAPVTKLPKLHLIIYFSSDHRSMYTTIKYRLTRHRPKLKFDSSSAHHIRFSVVQITFVQPPWLPPSTITEWL